MRSVVQVYLGPPFYFLLKRKPKQKFLQRIFPEGRDMTKKSEGRVVNYADELFRVAMKPDEHSPTGFCEEIFRMARRSEEKARNA